ncbi:MAG: PepSY-associated helix, partial [Steroidobacteraceae bacterium]|nr:PepSY-associated helix [Steroidobacteraceae bacterium]
MKLLRLRQLHRWVALVVALQVVLWTASGVMFAWLDQDGVAGAGLAEPPDSTALPAAAPLLEPARLPLAATTPVLRALELREVDGRWVYRVETDAGVRLLRASDGAPVAIDAAAARRLAASHYRGPGSLRTVKLHATETLETRKLGPTWEAAFEDASGTRLYFSSADGSLVA